MGRAIAAGAAVALAGTALFACARAGTRLRLRELEATDRRIGRDELGLAPADMWTPPDTRAPPTLAPQFEQNPASGATGSPQLVQ